MALNFSVDQIAVVIVDVEDIVRAAAANALERFGFLAAHIHEAESADEAVNKVKELQIGQGHVMLPIIVFLPQKFSGAFKQHTLVCEPFLVCTFSSARLVPLEGDGYFHYSMPKTFEVSKLSGCFEQCQQWWALGAAAPGNKPGDAPISSTAAHTFPAIGSQFGHGEAKQFVPQQADGSPRRTRGTRQSDESAPRLVGQGGYMGSLEAGVPDVVPPLASRGNTVECLDSLLPPKPPYEDIQLLCLVGRGSFGRVFKARWGVSYVAVKVVEHSEQRSQPSAIQFEGALSASLAHPNLAQTFKHSIREIRPVPETSSTRRGCEVWIVQEWCGLGTLNDRIMRESILRTGGFQEVAEVATEIASAAVYLHERGIIHGDLTSSNVLLVEKDLPKGYATKVSDFGLARVLGDMSGIRTATMGTVSSMPPELFQLEDCSLTKKVDVYAFGVLLWQLCTGTMPYEGLQPTQIVVMVAQGATLNMPNHVPERLRNVFTRCASRSPAERASFVEIVHVLLQIVGEFNPQMYLLGEEACKAR